MNYTTEEAQNDEELEQKSLKFAALRRQEQIAKIASRMISGTNYGGVSIHDIVKEASNIYDAAGKV